MLDKSIPYYNVIMKRVKEKPFAICGLPDSFSFSGYKKGDEKYWAVIEHSVGEFATIKEGLHFFKKNYLPFESETVKRVFFLNTADHKKIGTITAWWNETPKLRICSIHWVAIKPEYQSKGLGRPLINYGVQKLLELEGNTDIYLHTQTWSYKAIALYIKEGFQISELETFGGYRNDFKDAMPVLREKWRNQDVVL
jgi:ribosomal protein S18 acetylase RimI-like enzyme